MKDLKVKQREAAREVALEGGENCTPLQMTEE